MTIGKKLYIGFGSILFILVGLFVVNIIAGLREQSARSDASAALQNVRTIEAVRYQIMLNRNNLNNFLLSGDPRDEEKVNKGMIDIADIIKHGESSAASNDLLHTSLIQVESTEASWGDNFAKPLLAKRHQVDSGDATVSDLQIFYLQKDPTSWLLKSSAVLDQAATEIAKSLDETTQVRGSRQHAQHDAHDRRHVPRSRLGFCRRLLHREIDHRAADAPDHRRPRNRRLRRSRSEHRHSPQRRNRRLSDHIQQHGRLPERNGRSFRRRR